MNENMAILSAHCTGSSMLLLYSMLRSRAYIVMSTKFLRHCYCAVVAQALL